MKSYSDSPPAGKDVKQTSMLSTTAREPAATTTGTNTQKRHTTNGSSKIGATGAKGHP